MTVKGIQTRMIKMMQPERAASSQRFFKTGPGEYAEGDKFLGLPVPVVRALAKEYRDIPLTEVLKLIRSGYHEIRLLSLFILNRQFKKGPESLKKQIYDAYLKNRQFVNNWDLVDSSAEHIVGAYLWERDRSILKKLAVSKSLWDRRIAMLACFHFIKKNDYGTALELAGLLISDEEDLIHKAVGWMLREIGQRDRDTLSRFLHKHYLTMPRTALRYAIEKFDPETRQQYLSGTPKPLRK